MPEQICGAMLAGRAERWTDDDPRLPELVRHWLGVRPWWWSAPLPTGRRVAVVSSRSRRLLDPHGPWLEGLRAVLQWISREHAVAVVGHEAAGAEFVRRGAVRCGTCVISLHCCDLSLRSAMAWQRLWQAATQQPSSDLHVEGWALPPAQPHETCGDPAEPLKTIPQRDRATIGWADQVFVLGLRAGGNLHAILRARLQHPSACVRLIHLPGLQSPQPRDELIKLGATLWSAPPNSAMLDRHDLGFPAGATTGALAPVEPREMRFAIQQAPSPVPASAGWDFLVHTTRACAGPWPGQTRDEYIDSLLDARTDADHSALGTLMRIVHQRRLIASSRAIRAGYPVVSFTAVPLAELPRLHVFRSHRARWDFEPYGICVRRRWLEEKGARPVIYGDENSWHRLAPSDQPFFQLTRGSRAFQSLRSSTHSPSPIDWSVEREWRLVGDVDLTNLAASDGLLFVPTGLEARKLLEISPWPVTVLEHRARPLR